MKLPRQIALVVLLAFGSVIGSESASAQTIPYIGIGSNAKFNPANGAYSGRGTGIPVRQSINGVVVPVFDAETDPGVFVSGTFTGQQTMKSPLGSFDATLAGSVELTFVEDMPGLVEGMWFPSFQVHGGKGIFRRATGTLAGVAINHPFDPALTEWPFDYIIVGTIDLGWWR